MSHAPQRYRNAVVPHIYVDGAADAIAFYRRAFGAEELFRVTGYDGKILHAELAVAGSTIMLGDPDDKLTAEPHALGRCTASLHLFVDDNGSWMRRAVEAGCEAIQQPTDMFYGASSASVRDPYGHVWVMLVWKDDLSPTEMENRSKEALSVG
ncbi:MAG: VOC family protein [Alphaproteobacteria bacterium]|nr:VOC family protein [Alphaproteobacteria bacterium]MBL6937851.1 VOC family protein [Alphaproteobacteria bacterium]MBL7099323.1 VOC family protein [Alphaproteobacteria bacterium]